MGAEITLSSKGQIVIPKDVRDALDLRAGEKLTLTRVGRRIVIEASDPGDGRIDYAEFRRRLPIRPGPPLPIEQMHPDFDQLWPSED